MSSRERYVQRWRVTEKRKMVEVRVRSCDGKGKRGRGCTRESVSDIWLDKESGRERKYYIILYRLFEDR